VQTDVCVEVCFGNSWCDTNLSDESVKDLKHLLEKKSCLIDLKKYLADCSLIVEIG